MICRHFCKIGDFDLKFFLSKALNIVIKHSQIGGGIFAVGAILTAGHLKKRSTRFVLRRVILSFREEGHTEK
jgi:hypothetical protein